MTDLRSDMADAVRESVLILARQRNARPLDVLADEIQTFRENLDWSVGTHHENYWRLLIEVAEGPVKVSLV